VTLLGERQVCLGLKGKFPDERHRKSTVDDMND